MKKFCPNVVKKIKIPLYGGEVWLYLDREKFNSDKESMGLEVDNDGCSGETSTSLSEENGTVYLVGVFGENMMQTLVHELGHVTLFVCRSVGIDPSASNGEPYCYLLDYLFGEAAPEVAQAVMKEEGITISKKKKRAT